MSIAAGWSARADSGWGGEACIVAASRCGVARGEHARPIPPRIGSPFAPRDPMRHGLIFLLLTISAIAPARAAPPRPAQLGLCAACHGEDGVARVPGTPHLAGQDEEYLIDALNQYRSGRRDVAAMRAVSGALSEADIAALARWYAAQTPQGGATQ